jgi:hypothetical protein
MDDLKRGFKEVCRFLGTMTMACILAYFIISHGAK